MKNALVILSTVTLQFTFAQNEKPYSEKKFVILKSTKNYAEAKAVAVKAAKILYQKLDLRDLKPNKKTGLTFSDATCENEGGYPCYIARGRYDDGDYISIEWSNAINGFAKGYYVVIAGSSPSTAEALGFLKKVKKSFKDAYLKKAAVYIGCMH
jgi:hypothetical protein